MTHDENPGGEAGGEVGGTRSPACGFEAVMRDLDALTPEQCAAQELRAERDELGHDAYALGVEHWEQGRPERAVRWLRTAARYRVSGAQRLLDEISGADEVSGAPGPAESGGDVPGEPCRPVPSAGPAPAAGSDGLRRSRLRGGPTVQRILLGAQLRRLRQAAELRTQEAAAAVHRSASYVSRVECGRAAIKEGDLPRLLALYGVTDPQLLDQFAELARGSGATGWWHAYSDVMPDRLQTHIDLEQAASLIRTYEVQFVPALLQTPAYAAALTRKEYPDASSGEIERRVSVRMRRQQVLTRPNAPQLWAVVDESVLQRPFGGAEVMREQLAHLRTMARRPNVALQVLPCAQGPAAPGHPVTILRFDDADCPDIVHFEQLSGGVYVNRREEVASQLHILDRLACHATSVDATVDLLDRLVEEQASGPPSAGAAGASPALGGGIGDVPETATGSTPSYGWGLTPAPAAKAVEALEELLIMAS